MVNSYQKAVYKDSTAPAPIPKGDPGPVTQAWSGCLPAACFVTSLPETYSTDSQCNVQEAESPDQHQIKSTRCQDISKIFLQSIMLLCMLPGGPLSVLACLLICAVLLQRLLYGIYALCKDNLVFPVSLQGLICSRLADNLHSNESRVE